MLKKRFALVSREKCPVWEFKEYAQRLVRDHPNYTVVLYDFENAPNVIEQIARKRARITYISMRNTREEMARSREASLEFLAKRRRENNRQ